MACVFEYITSPSHEAKVFNCVHQVTDSIYMCICVMNSEMSNVCSVVFVRSNYLCYEQSVKSQMCVAWFLLGVTNTHKLPCLHYATRMLNVLMLLAICRSFFTICICTHVWLCIHITTCLSMGIAINLICGILL